ncbi:MAG: hypothetical protein FWE82_05820, partial [Defluviitaleaceae bacterium]|nr:hypothetical protein [Defluviitaleaceae bacterium]
MDNINESDPIEKIGFSTRVYNALQRMGIRTVGEMLALTREQISSIRNLGVKSVNEMEDVQKEIKYGGRPKTREERLADIAEMEKNISPVIFIDADGSLKFDKRLGDLKLPFRVNRILADAGFNYVSTILRANPDELLDLPFIGSGSAEKILVKISSIKF